MTKRLDLWFLPGPRYVILIRNDVHHEEIAAIAADVPGLQVRQALHGESPLDLDCEHRFRRSFGQEGLHQGQELFQALMQIRKRRTEEEIDGSGARRLPMLRPAVGVRLEHLHVPADPEEVGVFLDIRSLAAVILDAASAPRLTASKPTTPVPAKTS